MKTAQSSDICQACNGEGGTIHGGRCHECYGQGTYSGAMEFVAPAPISGLMDKRFVYVPAAATNIRATFERIREQQKKGQS